MKRILVINLKGGSGKSTTAFLCAQALAKAERPVAVRDLDGQKSVTGWIQAAGEGITLVDDHHTEGIEIIDSPPRLDEKAVITAVRQADVIILPCSPSLADTDPTRATAELVKQYMRPDATIRILFTQVQKGTTLASLLDEMATEIGVERLKTVWIRRQCYQRAPKFGWSELDRRAKDEVIKAILEVL